MHEYAIRVEDADIDMLGHASNIAVVRWIQDAAIAHSVAVGFSLESYLRVGAFFVIRRNEVDYLRPALRGEELKVRTWIASAAAAKCERATEFVRASDGEVVSRSVTTWGFVEAATGRPTRIPDEVRIAFGFPPRSRSAPPPPMVVPSLGGGLDAGGLDVVKVGEA
jgi:acyl-CoA thioester hydrolase